MDPKQTIVEILRKEGPMPIYRLAKEVGLSYGATQWYVFTLEREGIVETVKIGKRRYVMLKTTDWMSSIKVSDVLEDFMLTLAAFGVKPDMSIQKAVEILDRKAPHVAELLRKMIEKR